MSLSGTIVPPHLHSIFARELIRARDLPKLIEPDHPAVIRFIREKHIHGTPQEIIFKSIYHIRKLPAETPSPEWKPAHRVVTEGGDCEDKCILLSSILCHYKIKPFLFVLGLAQKTRENPRKTPHVWLVYKGRILDPALLYPAYKYIPVAKVKITCEKLKKKR